VAGVAGRSRPRPDQHRPRLVGPAVTWGGYCAPTRDGLAFGATHDRGEDARDVRPADHLRNLATLGATLPGLAKGIDDASLQGRASIRAATADHLPIAGPAVDYGGFLASNAGVSPAGTGATGHLPGLWVLGGLGGRGFATAPLLGEHVAAQIVGAPSPLPRDLAAAVHPARFLVRQIRRAPRSRRGAAALSSAPHTPQAIS
jgi:tRNA 5-methylaminomethyl-2-thiouridine biosynthesis bifunctional protein